MTTINHHKGQVETFRCANEIGKRRAAGESVRWIYGDLKERGALSITYNTFARWVGRIESGLLNAPAIQPERPRSTQGRSRSTNLPTQAMPSERGDSEYRPAEPKYIRMTDPIPPAPDSEPDLKALFGENE